MDDVGKLIQAINIIHNPNVSQQQRLAAQQFCEQIKSTSNPVQLAFYGANLANQSNASTVRHFGFHLIEYIIKEQWNSISNDQKAEIKENLLSVVANGTKEMLIEEKYIKEKVVRLIVECALREFPQRWPSLLPNLFDIAKMGEKQIELVIMILRTLPEDIKTFIHENLSTQRRRELLNGLTQQLNIIFDFIYKCLEYHYSSFVQLVNSGNSSSNQSKIQLKLVESLLTTLSSYVEWAPLNLITERNIPDVLCQLITQMDTRMSACENIILLLSRKGGKAEERLSFLFKYLPSITTALANRSNNMENDYLFHKQLAQMLQLNGLNFLAIVSSNSTLPPSFPNYLSIMLEFLTYPSTYISLIILQFWVVLVSHKTIVNQPFFAEYYIKLLKLTENKMLHFDPFQSSNDKQPASYFAKLDFDTRTEYYNVFGNARNKCLELVKAMTQLKPELTLEYINVRYRELLSQISAQGVNVESLKQLDSLEFFLLSITQGLDLLQKDYSANIANATHANANQMQNNVSSPFYLEGQSQLIYILESILKLLLEYESKDPPVLGYLVTAVEKFSIYYSVRSQALPFVFQKIFSIIQFRQANELNVDLTEPKFYLILSPETIATRRKACHALIRICLETSKSANQFMGKLLEFSRSLFAGSNILDAERSCIIEALIAASNGMEKAAQLEFVMGVVSPIQTDWCSDQISECVSSPQSLVNNLGISRSSTMPSLSPSAKKSQYFIHTLSSIWKRSSTSSSSSSIQIPIEHIVKILPNLFNLINSIHALWSPEIRSQLINPQFSSLFILDQTTTSTLLGLHIETLPEEKHLSEAELSLKSVRSWFDGMRDYGYTLLGSFSHTEQFYLIDQLPSAILNYLFGNYADFIESRHLKMLLRNIIGPIVTNCPLHRFNSFLLPIIPPFLNLLVTKLTNGWNKIQTAEDSSLAKMFAKSETDEVVEDKLLRDLTREFIHWVPKLLVLSPSIHQNTEGNAISMDGEITEQQQSPKTLHVLGIEEIMNPVLRGMIGCLSWPDSISFIKSVNFCAVAVPWIAKTGNQKYIFIIGEMLAMCLKLLRSAPHLQDHRGEFATLVHSIYMSLSKTSNIPQNVLMSLPKVTADTVQTLNQILLETNDEKKQKQAIRTFLQAYCEIPTEKKLISDLPEKLGRIKPQSSTWHDINSAEDLGLQNLM